MDNNGKKSKRKTGVSNRRGVLDSLREGSRKRSRVAASAQVTADAVKLLPPSWRPAITSTNNKSDTTSKKSNGASNDHLRDHPRREEQKRCATTPAVREAPTHVMPITRHGSYHVQPIKPSIRAPELLQRTVFLSHPPAFLGAVCIDVETTGFSVHHDDIVSIAAVELRWDGALLGQWCLGTRSFFRVVRPTRASDPRARRVHGYTEAELRKAPPMEEAMREFSVFISKLRGDSNPSPHGEKKEENRNEALSHNTNGDGISPLQPSVDPPKCHTLVLPPIIAHNARFDASLLQRQSLHVGWRLVWDRHSPLLCTQSLFRALYPHQAADLTRACQFFGIDVAGRSVQHNALQDAELCGRLFLRLSEKWHSVGT